MRTLSVLLLGLATAATGWAQSSAPTWLQMNIVKVKPEYVSEFIELQKNEISPISKKSGTPWRSAWRTAVFGNTYTFAFTTPIDTFAGYDEEREAEPSIAAKFPKYVLDRDSYALIFRDDLSKPRDTSRKTNVAVVTMVQVLPGKGNAYAEHLKKDVLPYMSDPKAGIQGYHVYQTTFGGSVDWIQVVYLDDFAFIDGGSPASRVLGEAGASAVSEKGAGLASHVERTLWRFLPELSYDSSSSTSSSQPQ